MHDPKSPIMKQHWVVLGNRLSNKQYEIYFGNDELPEIVSDTTLKGLLLSRMAKLCVQYIQSKCL